MPASRWTSDGPGAMPPARTMPTGEGKWREAIAATVAKMMSGRSPGVITRSSSSRKSM